jgi:membrane-bound metal-dependent hydrolase YbcI (DUF457 family)
MPLPIAHAVVGASLTLAVWPERTPAGFRRALVAGALLGVGPDLDYLLNVLRVLGPGWHHGVTHSVVFAVVVGVMASWVLGLRGWRGALACVLPVLSHPLLDYLLTESRGVALWWPVDRRYKLGLEELQYYRLVFGWDRRIGWGKLGALEVVVFVPVFAIAVLASRRRYRARAS